MNDLEQECIILNTTWDMIDSMVNWAMFVKHDRTEPTNMMFETHIHAQLFNILLSDFLSQLKSFKEQPVPLGLKAAPGNARPSDLTFLFYLRQICAQPKLGCHVNDLSKCTEAFATWLEGETFAEGVHFPSIGVVTDIRVTRYRYLKICGDIAKHNLARLASNVKHIRTLLEKSGHPIDEQGGYLAVPDFNEWFHTNIFMYHSSMIAEFLNNIRWAIFQYLQPEIKRSWHPRESKIKGVEAWGYHYPADCCAPIARAMYWELMNRAREKPYVPKFVVLETLKTRY